MNETNEISAFGDEYRKGTSVTRQILPRFDFIDDYDQMRRNIDVALFSDAAREIVDLHSLPQETLQLFPDGSNVIFAHGKNQVIKLFPHLLMDQYESERLVLKHLDAKLTISTPKLLHEGEIDGWPYLVMSRIEGITLETIWNTLDPPQKLRLIREIGQLIKQVHSLPTEGLQAIDFHWPQFLENQYLHCLKRHQKNGLKETLLKQLPDYLRTSPPIPRDAFKPVLLTGEYTPFNLLVRPEDDHWTLCGMIDFGDCMLGLPEYDLLGPGAFLIEGNAGLLREFLLSYGYQENDLTPKLGRKLTLLMLLHRFSNLKNQLRIPNWENRVKSFEDLEELVWPVSSA